MRNLVRWLLSSKKTTPIPVNVSGPEIDARSAEDIATERKFCENFRAEVTFDERRGDGRKYRAEVYDNNFYTDAFYGDTEELVLDQVRKLIQRKLTDYLVVSKAKKFKGTDL